MSAADLDVMFRAFADRTRLRLLNVLRGGEICVGDLVSIIDAPQPTISRHLAYLRKAGLVAFQKRGTWCIYSLAETRSPFHARLLDCLACCFDEVPELAADTKKARAVRAAGGCCPQPASPTGGTRDACCGTATF